MGDESSGEADEGTVVPGTEDADEPGETVDSESCSEVVPTFELCKDKNVGSTVG